MKSKTVLISGGNSGLGFEIAKQLVKKNYQVIILGKDKNKLIQATKKLASASVSYLVCDLRSVRNIKKIESKLLEVDILINCAGIIAYQPLEKQDQENILDIINVNLLGTILLTKAVYPSMKKRNEGTILNVSSTSGLPTGGSASQSVYIASKFGVTGFTDALKKDVEAEKINIKVLGFYPGGMNTKLFAKSGTPKDTSNFMDPKEVAKIAVFMIERPDSIKLDYVVVNRNKNK
jgi:uncharacterized protein